MTAAARSVVPTPPPTSSPRTDVASVTDAGREVLALERKVKSLELRVARFKDAIERLLAAVPSRVIGVETIDGAPTMFYSTGEIRRLTLVAVEGETPAEWRWEPVTPALATPARIVADALARDAEYSPRRAEMAVVNGDEPA